MTARHSAWMLTTLLLATAAAANRQVDIAPKASPSDEILVEGREIRSIATQYVERLLPSTKNGQFGRFEDPICPMVVGLSDKVGKEIADRMAAVGKAVRIDVQKQPCAPNLVLVVVPDKKAAIDGFRKSRPEYIKSVSPSLLAKMRNSNRPYASWQLAELFASDGMRIGKSDSRPTASNGATDGVRMFYELKAPRLKTTEPPSRLRANVKPHVQSSVVLVESGALANLDTRQLADFVLLQAMLPADQRNDDAPSSSILGVFNALPVSNDAPQSLTHADVAFLKSLRSVRSDTYASTQKNEIRQQMIDELRKTSTTRN